VAKMRLSDKAERVLRFLLGLRNRKIASALAGRGFTKSELEEGLTLLRAVATVSLAQLPPMPTDPAVINALDAWENEWFPVADASLSRHYPAVRDKLFLNLSQTEGPAVIVSVGTFVDRLATLTRAEGGYGADGKEARKLLNRRGLNETVIDRAKTLLGQVKEIESMPEPMDIEQHRAETAEAEAAMWGWYLEWSQIARSVIKDRGLLRQLGFLRPTSTTSADPTSGGQPSPTNTTSTIAAADNDDDDAPPTPGGPGDPS
jgi:hypothetical protein